MLKRKLSAVAIVWCISAVFVSPSFAQTCALKPDPYYMPLDVSCNVLVDVCSDHNNCQPTQYDYFTLGWDTFIALNWPSNEASLADRGEPDTNSQFGAVDGNIDGNMSPRPVVWMSYKDPSEVFLPLGVVPPADPGLTAWNTYPPRLFPTCTSQPPPRQTVLVEVNLAGALLGNEFAAGPLIDQHRNYVLLEQRFNQSMFEYLVRKRYYDRTVQELETKNGTFELPPDGCGLQLPVWANQGDVEVKASWRILTPEDHWNRYFRMEATFVWPDCHQDKPAGNCDDSAASPFVPPRAGRCDPVTVGLVGFHILRLTPTTHDTWFWATFEQVDNVTVRDDAPLGTMPSFNPGLLGSEVPPPRYDYHPCPLFHEAEENNGLVDCLVENPMPVNVSREREIPPSVQTLNTCFQNQFRSISQDNVWQYYEMIDVMNPCVPNPTTLPPTIDCNRSITDCPLPPTPVVAASCEVNPVFESKQKAWAQGVLNTTIETYVQQRKICNGNDPELPCFGVSVGPPSYSCFTCHAFATPFGGQTSAFNPAPKYPKFQVFSFLYRHANAPMPSVQPFCGDHKVNQVSEQCDGIDDAECPGSCESDCRCDPTLAIGRCCFGLEPCEVTNQARCDSMAGDFGGEGSSCHCDQNGNEVENACVVVESACCLPDGSCEITTQEQCDMQDGSFKLGKSCRGDGDDNGIDDACEGVPAASGWGIMILVLALLTGIAIKFGFRLGRKEPDYGAR